MMVTAAAVMVAWPETAAVLVMTLHETAVCCSGGGSYEAGVAHGCDNGVAQCGCDCDVGVARGVRL